MRMKDKVVLITGATTGIGFAAAEMFVIEGARTVMITGQDHDRLEAARAKLSGRGTEVIAVPWRADRPEDNDDLVRAIQDGPGDLHVVFANAGITAAAPLGQITAEDAARQMAINFTGPVLMLQAVTPLMRDGGSVIANTSCLDVLGMPGMTVYSASKAALRSAVRTMAAELGGAGIRVNAVAPGPVETPIYGKLGLPEDQLTEMAQGIVAQVPAGRFGEPDEIAEAVLFLASDGARYVRGAEIAVDGGWSNL